MENKTKIKLPAIKDGNPHTHTQDSLKDCASRENDIVAAMFHYGARCVFFDDHGSMTGFELQRMAVEEYQNVIKCCTNKDCEKCKFGKACGNNPTNCTEREYAEFYINNNRTLKGITGVEAYFEDESLFVKRAHLLLLPKDNIGFTALCQAVTESNKNMDSQNFPRMNLEMLKTYFGPGSTGHGHVIASSACMLGVLAAVFLANSYIENDIEKLTKKISQLYSPLSPQYERNKASLDKCGTDIQTMTAEIKSLERVAKRPFVKKEKALKSAEGSEMYEAMRLSLEAEKQETAEAIARIELLKKQRDEAKIEERRLKAICKEEEKDHEKWYAINEQIQTLQASILSDEQLYEQAKQQALLFDDIFGHGNFYAELQYHRIPQEAKAMPLIAKLADELGIPLVATNDAHMVRKTPEELKRRQIIRSMRYNQWEEMSSSDEELYIKTDEELRSILLEILSEDVVNRAMQGIGDIVDACNVEYEFMPHYPVFISDVPGEDSVARLRRLSYEGIKWRYPGEGEWTKEFEERLEYELGIITKLGYCDYLCIVQDFLDYARLLGRIDTNNPDPRYLADPFNINLLREITKDKMGVGVGPGRGSGVGSLVCYLTGITSVDPMRHGLIFERFLNAERVSMPDIDSDIRSDIRDQVIDYVKHKYGAGSVCCIMNRGTQAAKAAIRNCARLLGSELHDDTRAYLDLGDAIAKAVPPELGIKLASCEKELREKFAENKAAQTIITNAMLVEGSFINVGMHAAGVIIADNGDVSQYVPLMYIPGKGQMATQCDKDVVEGRGLLKMDFLGLRNLCIMHKTIMSIKENYGKDINLEALPFEREVFDNIFAEGNTNSVFQFESSGMKQMLRQFQPTNIDDIILLVAAYRPGPMQYLDSVIAVKHGKKKPEYVIPEMETILGGTYGSAIFQEQIMEIFNKFAGFSLGESDIIRRYMSKKKTEKFAAYKDKFINGLIERGAIRTKAEEFWEQLVEFSRYAFNKSHAAAYAYVAYQTAWLKYHYPKEYLCAVINYTKFEKLGSVMGDCRTFNIPIKAPNINKSQQEFSVQEDSIVCGLSNIKGLGAATESLLAERKTNGPFKNFTDFMLRTRSGEGLVTTLIEAGAFDEFSNSRTALRSVIPLYVNIINKIKTREKTLADATSDEKKITRAQEAIQSLIQQFQEIIVDNDIVDDNITKLTKEKELVGAFVSSHPMDSYDKPQNIGCTPINKLSVKANCSIVGVISDLRIAKRKKDGASMAFFNLDDKTDIIEVCCFTKAFKEIGDKLQDNVVLKLIGDCREEENYNADSDTDEKVLKFYLTSVEVVEQKKRFIVLRVKNFAEWNDVFEGPQGKIHPYRQPNGYHLKLYIESIRSMPETPYLVSSELVTDKNGFDAFFHEEQ